MIRIALPESSTWKTRLRLVAETFDWDEEKVSDDEEVTQVKVLMALADDEFTIRKNHARNGEWIDIIMRKLNILLSMDEDADWILYYMICKKEDHRTSDHEMYTAFPKRSENYKAQPYQGGALPESSQSSESSIGVKCNTCESTVYSIANHNEFDHFKRGFDLKGYSDSDYAGCNMDRKSTL
nr:retrovirus-related Pol polyprotein from transposon TNT 1-94 [Tanacetum cinerariifolium]